MAKSFKELNDRIDYLASLKKGWFGPPWNHRCQDKTPIGEPVSPIAVDNARSLVMRLWDTPGMGLFPMMDDGGIRFEWETINYDYGVHIDCRNDGIVEYFSCQLLSGSNGVFTAEFELLSMDRVVELVMYERSKVRA